MITDEPDRFALRRRRQSTYTSGTGPILLLTCLECCALGMIARLGVHSVDCDGFCLAEIAFVVDTLNGITANL